MDEGTLGAKGWLHARCKSFLDVVDADKIVNSKDFRAAAVVWLVLLDNEETSIKDSRKTELSGRNASTLLNTMTSTRLASSSSRTRRLVV